MPDKGMGPDFASSLLEELIPEEVRNNVNEENEGDKLAKAMRKKKLAGILLRVLLEKDAGLPVGSMEWRY